MRIAAEAGVAPRVVYANAGHGVAIIAYIQSKPAQTKRAKERSLRAVVTAVKRLHVAHITALVEYLEGVGVLIRRCQATRILPKNILAKYLKIYQELAAVYQGARPNWYPAIMISTLAMCCSEASKSGSWIGKPRRRRSYVDLAALANFFAESESDKEVILQSYFGAATSDGHRARLWVMQQVNRIPTPW